jgi:UDPglucose 6-dehydrogenase
LCRWLSERGAEVVAHDPRVRDLPQDLAAFVQLAPSIVEAVRGASAIVIATPWPDYRDLPAASVLESSAQPVVVDANRLASKTLDIPGIEYIAVGTPSRRS